MSQQVSSMGELLKEITGSSDVYLFEFCREIAVI
jgi:hypothetical protein